MSHGLLLVQLGTPDDPSTGAVRRYLGEFLMDEDVIDINPIARWFLVHGIILRTRPRRSAKAYQKIWTKRGSPLLFHSQDLARKVSDLLAPHTHVALGMRYGQPNIRSALEKLREKGVARLTVFPLYPQYSTAATRSALNKVQAELADMGWAPTLREIHDFYFHEDFLDAFAKRIDKGRKEFGADHILFSFHGLPERQIKKTDETGAHCFASASCCDAVVAANRNCYRAQCFSTARKIARKLDLADDRWSISFQSRLGSTPWIKPYTDLVLPELAAKGVKRVLVTCPAFVADCLETLEEIGIRAREDFKKAGGQDLQLVPSLNSDADWAQAIIRISREN